MPYDTCECFSFYSFNLLSSYLVVIYLTANMRELSAKNSDERNFFLSDRGTDKFSKYIINAFIIPCARVTHIKT